MEHHSNYIQLLTG